MKWYSYFTSEPRVTFLFPQKFYVVWLDDSNVNIDYTVDGAYYL